MSDNKDKSFKKLLSLLRYDARKRFEVLREELNHLANSIKYRINPEVDFDLTALSEQANTNEQPFTAETSHEAFLYRLGLSAQALLNECNQDIEEIQLVEDIEKLKATSRPREQDVRNRQVAEEFAIIWNAKVVNKALVLAERLGDLHDRLEQFLQRTNPDHPDPTLRRRCEQGLTDKYLSELARWTHMDLARFSLRLKANYPYDKVPSTYQFWDYDHTSRHHSFIGLDEHNAWRKNVDTFLLNPAKTQPLSAPTRFVSVALSYWMPERLALVPIIGHELAHQVLRTIYGREVSFSLVERDGSELARVYQRLTNSAEAWLSRRVYLEGLDARFVSNLVTEILCDVFAAIRFGYGYAYAWTLETLSEDRFSHLFHDEYGMLRRLNSEYSGLVSSDTANEPSLANAESSLDAASSLREKMRKDAFSLSAHLRRGLLAPLYRGRVMISVLKRLRLERDAVAQDFESAFETLLSVMLRVYTSEGPNDEFSAMEVRASYEDEMARDLARSLCDEVLFGVSADIGDSQFIRIAKDFWAGFTVEEIQDQANSRLKPAKAQDKSTGDRRNNESSNAEENDIESTLERQLLNNGYRELLDRTLAPLFEGKDAHTESRSPVPESSPFHVHHCKTFSDAAWRMEWLIEGTKLEANSSPIEIDALRNQIRELTFLGMDDYLFRTASPARLFSVIAEEKSRLQALKAVNLTNSVHKDNVKKAYDVRPIIELDKKLQGLKTNEPSKVSIAFLDMTLTVSSEMRKWLPGKILDPNLLPSLVESRQKEEGTRSVFFLDLMKVRSTPSVLRASMRTVSAGSGDRGQHPKYVPICSGSLLGRYDAFVIYRQASNDGDLNWKFSGSEPSSSALQVVEPASPQSAYVSRTKRLVQVFGSNVNSSTVMTDGRNGAGALNPVAVILVSLKWDASRILVARWLTSTQLTSNVNLRVRSSVFLSDGWEDIVLVIGSGAEGLPVDSVDAARVANGHMRREIVEACLPLIRLINENPFVAGTETLFSSDILESPPAAMRFRFAFRAGKGGHAAARSQLQSALRERGFEDEIYEVAGNKDFEILVDDANHGKHVGNLHEFLHDRLGDSCRLETRVLWRESASSGETEQQ